MPEFRLVVNRSLRIIRYFNETLDGVPFLRYVVYTTSAAAGKRPMVNGDVPVAMTAGRGV
jgi:hypothetical protein